MRFEVIDLKLKLLMKIYKKLKFKPGEGPVINHCPETNPAFIDFPGK